MVTIHSLKCIAPFFTDILSGLKTWEIRYNDRDFHVGDILHLLEVDQISERLTGRECRVKVEYLVPLDSIHFKHYVGMSIRLMVFK
jgi:hypothetical protein